MTKPVTFVLCLLLTVSVMISVPFSINVSAAEQTIALAGEYYEFDKKSGYEIDESTPTLLTEHTSIGNVSVIGNFSEIESDDDIPAYEVADGELFSVHFSYDDSLSGAEETEWHICSDSSKTVNGIQLESKIGSGAFILQTSLDGEKWVNSYTSVDLKGDIEINGDNCINDIQLTNGCYYRIIIAYETQKQVVSSNLKVAIWDTPLELTSDDTAKNAEVYEFYAGYKKVEEQTTGQRFYYTTLDYACSTPTNDYTGNNPIGTGDPHYGWSLGAFCISGYTDVGDDSDIYLKSVGNKVKLTFNLEQDITALNGKDNLSVAIDENGSDGAFQTLSHNMGHGELIVKHTDEEGISTITEYSNYLEALAYPGADTTIQLFEEGDYVVHLDYAITDSDKMFNGTTYYQMSFSFKIRNSNCMVYIFDTQTGSELGNGDVTENGFRIDSAKSSYPKLTVKKEILNNSASGLTEDVRFNRSAADGEAFTDEGIYTITASNRFDEKLEPVVKTIYVGSNNILAAYTRHLGTGEEYTVAELQAMIDNGYTITDSGEIIEPVVDNSEFHETTAVLTSAETDDAVAAQATVIAEEFTDTHGGIGSGVIILTVVILLIIAGVIAGVIIKNRKIK